MIIIKNGRIHNAVEREAFVADILIENGKIKEIAKNIENEEAEIIDAEGKQIYPGFVEAHCHTGIAGRAGQGRGNSDDNEYNDPVTPHLRAIDAVDPQDANFKHARAAGVTCICTGPGSSNAFGGTFAAMKTAGVCADDMVVKTEVAMKCAFGENIKSRYGSKCVSSRMTTAALIRETLSKAKYYKRQIEAADDESKYPAFDAKLHALLPVLRGEMPLKAHVHQANDIFTAIRIAKEFGVRIALEHVTDGAMIADKLAKTGIPVAIGPTLSSVGEKYEIRNKSWETPGVLARAGCRVSIITDATVSAQEYLPICAGYAVKAGMDPFEALRAITINAAEHIGIADRVGSIETGKDADIVITDGSPFEVSTVVEKVLIDGKIIYNKERGN